MKCTQPFVKAGEVYPCGQCLPCRFVRARVWYNRILMEASCHDYSSTITLTYDPAAEPADGGLRPKHLQDWLKRFRKRGLERYPWRHYRFYAAGEYGENAGRPHYHAILFGLPGCANGRTGRQWCCDCGCDTCSDVTDTWSLGASSCQALDRRSAAYVAGYVTRKVSTVYIGPLVKPFIRMSNRPFGIGAPAMFDVASTMLQYNLVAPRYLGRYLRRKAEDYAGQDYTQFEVSDAMRRVRAFAWHNSRSIQSVLRELNEPYASQMAQKEAQREKVL